MNRSLYTLLYYLALPLILLRLLSRSRGDIRYRQRWPERLGYYSQGILKTGPRNIVFHTVSVGELHAAVPLIRACMEKLPDWTLTLTTTTITGSARVHELFGDDLHDRVQHCYIPYDLPGAVKRFLKTVQPQVMVIMETELWPNLLHYSAQQGCRILLLNARLSEKSFRNYRKHAALTRATLRALYAVAAQFDSDGEHFRTLGLPQQALRVCGTMKFDQEADNAQLDAAKSFRQNLDRRVLVAGSTRAGEEIKVLRAFRILQAEFPDLLLVLVPRHPERFSEVEALLGGEGLSFVRRSARTMPGESVQVLLGDSMGEMQFYYACADVAFVGGSLVDTGCQNIIEPAALGVPVITGPSLFNFKSVSELLIAAGAMRVVADEKELAQAAAALFRDPQMRDQTGAAAAELVAGQRGATERQLQLILQATRSDQSHPAG